VCVFFCGHNVGVFSNFFYAARVCVCYGLWMGHSALTRTLCQKITETDKLYFLLVFLFCFVGPILGLSTRISSIAGIAGIAGISGI